MKIEGWQRVLRALCLSIALAAGFASYAQTSNTWINYGQPYYKIRVAGEGIYRLTHADLQAAVIPVGSIDPRRFNLFQRVVELAIIVSGQNYAVFDPADVI